MRLVNPCRPPPAAMRAVIGAGPPSRTPAASLRPVLGEGGRLPLAGAPRRVELLLEPLALLLPTVAVFPQSGDLLFQFLDTDSPRIPHAPGSSPVVALPRRLHALCIGTTRPDYRSVDGFFYQDPLTEYQESTAEDGRLHVFATPTSLIKPYDSDVVSIVANFARLRRDEQVRFVNGSRRRHSEIARRLYQLIRSEKPYFDERMDPRDLYRVFVVEPQQLTERIRVQSGAFLVSAFHERFERDEILKWNKDIPVYAHCALTIPSSSKSGLLDELRLLNVSGEILFPGLDASARAVTAHYLQRTDGQAD